MDESKVTESAGKRKIGWLPIFALVLASVSIAFAALVYVAASRQIRHISFGLDQKIDALNTTLSDVTSKLQQGKYVDLTKDTLQEVGSGFLVTITSVDAHLTGVIVKGRLLNDNSTDRENVKFTIRMGSTDLPSPSGWTALAFSGQDLTVQRVSSGYAARFEVYIPDIDPKDTKSAYIEYQDSTAIYRNQY